MNQMFDANQQVNKGDGMYSQLESAQKQAIAVIDLGGQYCHMIGRRLRDVGVETDILESSTSPDRLQDYAGIILSGGPQSVYDRDSLTIDARILDLKKPILGICYGHQLLAHLLKCEVRPSEAEYGKAMLHLEDGSVLFDDTPSSQPVWMSHGDSVHQLTKGLKPLARTESCKVAAFGDLSRNIFGVQFHPEVVHTEYGRKLLENFSRKICNIRASETLEDRVERLESEIREKVGSRSVFFFVSGGVDSTVAFSLCARALPRDRVLGVYVDTGLMRENETNELRSILSSAGLSDRLKVLDKSTEFLEALKGKTDPEEKRKIIGKLFVEAQALAMNEFGLDREQWLLGQGTIYPDTVESGGTNGNVALIKTHHNRCEEIQQLIAEGKIIEPLAEFYKDEVREIGRQIGLDKKLTSRWPFPGPGLAIRCICTQEKRTVGHINSTVQTGAYEAVCFPIRSVGVQGDSRTYREVVAVRGPLDYDALGKLSTSLCNTSRLYNRAIAYVAGSISNLDRARVEKVTLTSARIRLLRRADHIVRSVMEAFNIVDSVWQFPTVLIPISFKGGESVVLRPINSEDGMTANFARLPVEALESIGSELVKIPGIDAVFLDITDKPPATIEWE